MMDKQSLFAYLAEKDAATLLKLLDNAYELLDPEKRLSVFGEMAEAVPPSPVDGPSLLSEVEFFEQQSLVGTYYAPFSINSRNYSYIPQDTENWFEELDDFLDAATQLTRQGDHLHAVKCFRILFKLIEKMEYGEEIVFAHELGSWMIAGDEREYVAAYMTSLAASTEPQEFTAIAIPFIKRDSYHSFFAQAHQAAVQVSNTAQQAALKTEIERQNIRTPQ